VTARDFRRRFSRSERVALFVAAGGRCSCCGTPLDSSFHADHREAWAHGGATDVINGQALCGPCNQAKGDGHQQSVDKRALDPASTGEGPRRPSRMPTSTQPPETNP